MHTPITTKTVRILKFNLTATGITPLQLTRDASVLAVRRQRGQTVLWAVMNLDEPRVTRCFAVFFTGQHEVPDNAKYVETLISEDGWSVDHIFELLDAPAPAPVVAAAPVAAATSPRLAKRAAQLLGRAVKTGKVSEDEAKRFHALLGDAATVRLLSPRPRRKTGAPDPVAAYL